MTKLTIIQMFLIAKHRTFDSSLAVTCVCVCMHTNCHRIL